MPRDTPVLTTRIRRLVRWAIRRMLRGDPYLVVPITIELLSDLHAVHAELFHEDNAGTRRRLMEECLESAHVPL